jgi:deoxyadenosine/deoxycytidine kinase
MCPAFFCLDEMKIGIVGPCAAGKTTLEHNLVPLSYDAHAIAQEHSQAQTMWQQIGKPEILIYLDASLATICARLNVNWEQSYLDEQNRRLAHARVHADFALVTDDLSREQVAARVIEYVKSIPAPGRDKVSP